MKHTTFSTKAIYVALFFLLSLVSQSILAQEKVFNVKVVPATEAEGMLLYISTQNLGAENKTSEATLQDGTFVVTTGTSNSGFYNLVLVKDNAQSILPVYFGSSEGNVSVDVKYQGGRVSVEGSAENKALSEYNEILMQKGIALWSGKSLDEAQQKQLIASYKQVADSLAAQYDCTAEVKKYIEISGYTSAYNAYTALPRAMGVKRSDIAFSVEEVLPDPSTTLDHELTSLFPVGKHIMLTRVPKGALCDRLQYIDAHYKNEMLKKMLVASLVESFVTNTKAASNYETGLAELTIAVEKYGVDKKYVAEYAKLRNVIPGSSFPTEVVLEDINGGTVDFASFKGKYVYIDLWASWCGPCVREIPHLQALEAEMAGGDVVFVSISVDTSKDAWKKRVEALKLHGNQFIDAGGKLSSALNVQGIPHFLIYDKEGKLHTYKALRPSSGETLRNMLKNLK